MPTAVAPTVQQSLPYDEIEFLKESNAIEGVYDPLSLSQAMLAWEFMKRDVEMTEAMMLKAHKILMIHQASLLPRHKGAFRDVGVRVGSHICPNPNAVPYMVSEWLEGLRDTPIKKWNPLVSHIVFEGIHPFVDGNGRIGRMLFNWMRWKQGLPIQIFREADKHEYYKLFQNV